MAFSFLCGRCYMLKIYLLHYPSKELFSLFYRENTFSSAHTNTVALSDLYARSKLYKSPSFVKMRCPKINSHSSVYLISVY